MLFLLKYNSLLYILVVLYLLLLIILSIMPPVLPIRKHPGLIPPTVAGPIIVTCFSLATRRSLLVMFSGMPSAMIAIVRIFLHAGNIIVSIVTSYADRSEAKLTKTETFGCA